MIINQLKGGAVNWTSKKQAFISHSTIESKFKALITAAKDVNSQEISYLW